MRQRRTDLALEAKELWEESARQTARLEGVEAFTETREGFLTETVRILDERGEEALGKPAGRYVTLTMDGLARREEDAFPRAARAVGGELARLMDGVPGRGLALVVGLGNRAITPDAIGPKVHEHTLVTRHLVEQIPEHFGAFRPVASLSAGVLGTTGMESGELVQAVCRRLKPACVVAVDALASRSLKRLCRTVAAVRHGDRPRLRGGQPPVGPGPGLPGGAGAGGGGAHGGGRVHPGRRPAGAGGAAPSGGGAGPVGYPQGHRQPGGRSGQSHRLWNQFGAQPGLDVADLDLLLS